MPGSMLEAPRSRRDEMLATIAELVRHESFSRDKPALDALARTLASRLEAVGAEVEIVPGGESGGHVRACFQPPPSGVAVGAKPALILCHFDTVWPPGTLASRPFRLDQGRAYGPGIYDMKA